MAAGLGGAAGGVLALEVCAPLLLLCWLCCWPADDHSETSSSGKPPRKPVVLHGRSSRRQSSDLLGKRVSSSAASLHLPSTSGHSKQSLKSHRSHEEIPRRRQSHHLETKDDDPRYHSAPSVIDEVIHRRDWERSTKDLYIPLKPDIQVQQDSDDSPEAPCAEPESSSIECKSEERLSVPCKKHYANIKSSKHRNKKELTRDNEKDTDATETSSFYIGDMKIDDCTVQPDAGQTLATPEKVKSVYKAKDAKQSFNESIKSKDRSNVDQDSANDFSRLEGFKTKMFDIDTDLYLDELDRSGARHYMESRTSLYPCVSTSPFPPASVEVLGYSGGACLVAEVGSVAALRQRERSLRTASGRGTRARHASDGDILAAAPRPESGAFSDSASKNRRVVLYYDAESDVELEAALCEERPPPYHELQHYAAGDRKETAI